MMRFIRAFLLKKQFAFAIIAVYIYDLNIIGTLEELIETATYLKNAFEIKDLEKTILSWFTN